MLDDRLAAACTTILIEQIQRRLEARLGLSDREILSLCPFGGLPGTQREIT